MTRDEGNLKVYFLSFEFMKSLLSLNRKNYILTSKDFTALMTKSFTVRKLDNTLNLIFEMENTLQESNNNYECSIRCSVL